VTSGPLEQSGGFGPAQSVPARGAVASARFDALRKQFGIEATAPEATIVLDKKIVPVQNIDWIAPRGLAQIDNAVDLSGSIGIYTAVFTCPQDERWIITLAHQQASTGNSRVVAVIGGVQVNISILGTAEKMLTGLWLQLESGDTWGALQTGNPGDASNNENIAGISYKIR